MGVDKARLKLDGKPLIEHAVEKLRAICADVCILSGNRELAVYAPLVADLHPGCGPLAGIEAALAHSSHDWNLLLPVDLPMLPVPFLRAWAESVCVHHATRVSYCEVDGKPHPALLLIRRESTPKIASALERHEYKLLPTLRSAACDEAGLQIKSLSGAEARRWFANLNTPEDLKNLRAVRA